MWGRSREAATEQAATSAPGSPSRVGGFDSLGQPLSYSDDDATAPEPAADRGTVLHYWGVKSRATAIAYTLGYFAPDADITYATAIAYPGTPEYAACA
jgi:hypothetical protein|eukprot:COSAG06_NODE_292_length_18211_cov_36.536937_7_plen_98_part_00